MAKLNESPSTPSSSPTRICVFASTLAGNSPAYAACARALAKAFHNQGIHLIYGGGTSGLMGELARERVRLGGAETVTGIIPGALVPGERGVVKGGIELTPVQEPDQPRKEKQSWVERTLKGLMKKDKGDGRQPPQQQTIDTESADALLASSTFGSVTVTPSLAARKALMIELIAKGGPGSGFIALPGGFGTFDEIGDILAAKQLGIHKSKMVLFNVEGYWDGILQWVESGMAKGIVRDDASGMLVSEETAEGCVQALAAKQESRGEAEGGAHPENTGSGVRLPAKENGEEVEA